MHAMCITIAKNGVGAPPPGSDARGTGGTRRTRDPLGALPLLHRPSAAGGGAARAAAPRPGAAVSVHKRSITLDSVSIDARPWTPTRSWAGSAATCARCSPPSLQVCCWGRREGRWCERGGCESREARSPPTPHLHITTTTHARPASLQSAAPSRRTCKSCAAGLAGSTRTRRTPTTRVSGEGAGGGISSAVQTCACFPHLCRLPTLHPHASRPAHADQHGVFLRVTIALELASVLTRRAYTSSPQDIPEVEFVLA